MVTLSKPDGTLGKLFYQSNKIKKKQTNKTFVLNLHITTAVVVVVAPFV